MFVRCCEVHFNAEPTETATAAADAGDLKTTSLCVFLCPCLCAFVTDTFEIKSRMTVNVWPFENVGEMEEDDDEEVSVTETDLGAY